MLTSDLSQMLRCACGNLRRTTRAVTQYYDQALQSTGLRSTQCSLLIVIALHENALVSELGTLLLMDQTTVTRNISILKKHCYIKTDKIDSDARKKAVAITESGIKKLAEVMPLWEQAQSQIEQGLGADRFRQFLKTLNEITQLMK